RAEPAAAAARRCAIGWTIAARYRGWRRPPRRQSRKRRSFRTATARSRRHPQRRRADCPSGVRLLSHQLAVFGSPAFILERQSWLRRYGNTPFTLKAFKVVAWQERRKNESSEGLQPVAQRWPRERQRSIAPRGRLEIFGRSAGQRLDRVGNPTLEHESAVLHVLCIVAHGADQEWLDTLTPAGGFVEQPERHVDWPHWMADNRCDDVRHLP